MKKLLLLLFVFPLFFLGCDKDEDCNIDHKLIEKLSAEIEEIQAKLDKEDGKLMKENYQMQIDELSEKIGKELDKCK